MSHTQPPLPPTSLGTAAKAQEDLVRLLVPDAAGAPHGVMMNGVSAGGAPSMAFGHAADTTNPPRRKSKRRGSDGQRIVTGRSFKRLRIDHVHFTNANATVGGGGGTGGGFPSTHSTGTLSVGTMGGDLESNDEDLGEEDDDETEDGAHTHPGESVASSWVASLGGSHGGFRKRRLGGTPMGGNAFGEGAVDTFQPLPTSGARTFQPLHDEDEDDDARTCSAMTTAAVAPRRRRPRHGGKRKAIGFTIDAPASTHPHAMPGKHHDELDLEAVEMDATLGSGKRSDNSSRKALPPIDQIPDPLLVAAQHAAGGDNMMGTMPQQGGPSVAFDTAALAAPADAAQNKVGGTVLVMGDCCSSVTEEDGSLAEDEASISAISIGANTTVSALSGGMEGSLPPTGMPGSFEHIERQRSMQGMRQTNPSPAPGGAAKGTSPSEYAPLNVILGGLHKERLTRLSTNRSLSRGESSLHSMGSEGAHSGGDGGSYRSLPGNIHAAGVSVSWNAAMAAAHPPHAPPAMSQRPPLPPSFVQQQQQQPPLAMDEDAEMEEADGGGKIGPVGSFQSGTGGGSVASHHGSHAESFSSGAAVASCGSAGGERGGGAADPNVPTWKRRVHLPSHSSLY